MFIMKWTVWNVIVQAGHDGLWTNNLIEFVVTDKYKVNENTLSLCWVLKLYLKTGIFEYKYNSASYLCYNPLNKIYIVILIGIIKTSSMVNMADHCVKTICKLS